MAEASVVLNQEQFSCPICLDLLKNPVAIPCGHSFCMDCITECWDHEKPKRVYSCPECRQTFTQRPVLGRNTILAELVEKLQFMELQPSPPINSSLKDVVCSVCVGRKQKAIKSCLECQSSYCKTHLKAHNDLNPGKKHKVIDAVGKLEDLICSHHDKLLEVFCRTDQTCICVQCVLDEHKGHDTVSAAAERTEKQRELRGIQRKSQQLIKDRERELQELHQDVRTVQRSAQVVVKKSKEICAEMIRSIEKRCLEVEKQIKDQERGEMSRAEELVKKMEQEITELKRKNAELEQLLHTDNHVYFLQMFRSLHPPSTGTISELTVWANVSFEKAMELFSQLKEEFEDFFQAEHDILKNARDFITIEPPQPITREEFLRYSCELLLDSNTANKWLRLSEGNTMVEYSKLSVQYPDHPERFHSRQQVLCSQAVSKRCYWEVEWSGIKGVAIAVSYRDISRKALESYFGYNEYSWSLECSSSFCFKHNSKATPLGPVPMSCRVGVYVDHKAGILAFFSISSGTMILLHKVQTKFTQALYPGFYVAQSSALSISTSELFDQTYSMSAL